MRIVREGWPFIIGCLLVSHFFLLSSIFLMLRSFLALAVVFFLLTAFCVYFFRDPLRVIPQDESLVLCPADGKVLEVIEGTDPTLSGPVWIIRIFLSVFDPHLQRSPVSGRVQKIDYKRGKFLDARDPRAAFENEQNRVVIEATHGPMRLVVTQIAGLIARRIVCWVREGQSVKAGERIGLIRFGSQVDVVLPKACEVRVKAGDRVTAGDTILARR